MKSNQLKKIVITGGGSGGHIVPLASVASEIIANSNGQDFQIYYLGPNSEMARQFLVPQKVIMRHIIDGKIRRYFSLQNIIDIFFKIPFGFLQSFFWLAVINPALVFSKGGSGSYVVCMAARLLDIPVFIHESDSVPGLSNKKVAPYARKIFISFPQTEFLTERGAICTGNPIRKNLLGGSKEEARKMLGITSSKPVLLFSGGSQGAQFINEFILSVFEGLLTNYEVIHIAGAKNYQATKTQANALLNLNPELKPFYHLYDFLNEVELKNAYSLTDVIITRASGTIFEIAALGKPSILIPLPTSAGNHQSKNAYQYSQTGAGITIEQPNLTPHFFLGQVQLMLEKSEEIKPLALKFARVDAAKNLAQEIIDYVINLDHEKNS